MPLPIPIVKADLEVYVGVADIAHYSRGTGDVAVDANVDRAIKKAWSRARSAGTNVFTPESWDAMTAETLPEEAHHHISWDAISILAGGNTTNTQIKEQAAEASKWRAYLVSGKARCFDGVLVKRESGSGSVTHVRRIKRVFERTPGSEFNFVEEKLV